MVLSSFEFRSNITVRFSFPFVVYAFRMSIYARCCTELLIHVVQLFICCLRLQGVYLFMLDVCGVNRTLN